MAYAMVAQNLTVSQHQTGAISIGVALPRLIHTSAAVAISSAPSSQVAEAPMFSVHLPILRPIILVPSAIQMAASDAVTRYIRLSARCAYWGPSVKAPALM